MAATYSSEIAKARTLFAEDQSKAIGEVVPMAATDCGLLPS